MPLSTKFYLLRLSYGEGYTVPGTHPRSAAGRARPVAGTEYFFFCTEGKPGTKKILLTPASFDERTPPQPEG